VNIINEAAVRQISPQQFPAQRIIIQRNIRPLRFADEEAVCIVLVRRRACGEQIIPGIVSQRSARAVSFLISAGAVGNGIVLISFSDALSVLRNSQQAPDRVIVINVMRARAVGKGFCFFGDSAAVVSYGGP
jgi:hypothetical protein